MRWSPRTIQHLTLIAALCCALVTPALFSASAEERAKAAGELLTIKGHRVLRLYGPSPKERGFAHGYWLAADIVADLDGALTSLPNFGRERFETKLKTWARERFAWTPDVNAELDGIYDGFCARLNEDARQSAVLGRALNRDDLYAMNALADWFGPACSGFSVWKDRAADGGVLHARTLDFPLGPRPVADQVLFAVDALPAAEGRAPQLAWVAVGWPGLLAQFTGMNSAGLVACIHDGYNTQKADKSKEKDMQPRGILLRQILASVDPAAGDPAEAAALLTKARRSACGNLFHLSWPLAQAGKAGPSAVLEFETQELETKVRRPEGGALVLTNHFCVLSPAVACTRFSALCEGLAVLEQSKSTVGLREARRLLAAAEQPVAAHSVYFFPDKRELAVALTRGNVMSPRVVPTAFTFQELFRAP